MLRVIILLLLVSRIGYSQPGILINDFATTPSIFNQAQLDAASIFRMDQNTPGVTVVFPNPTNPALSKNLQISNIGTADLILVPGGVLPGRKVVVNAGVTTTMYATIFMNWRSNGWGVTAAPSTNVVQSANTGFFGPVSGASADPSFRGVVPADIVTAESDPIWIAQKPLYQTIGNLSTDLTPNANKYPNTIAVNAGLNTKEPAVTVGTTAQYYRGDKTWQTFPSFPSEVDPTVPSYSKTLTAFSVIKSSTDPLYVPVSRTLTINGTAFDLSANRTYTVTASPNIAAPVAGTTITMGTPFQPRAGGPCHVLINGSLTGALGLNESLTVAMSATSGGTYTTVATDVLLIGVLGLTLDRSCASIPVPYNTTTGGWWVRVTRSGTASTATYTKWDL